MHEIINGIAKNISQSFNIEICIYDNTGSVIFGNVDNHRKQSSLYKIIGTDAILFAYGDNCDAIAALCAELIGEKVARRSKSAFEALCAYIKKGSALYANKILLLMLIKCSQREKSSIEDLTGELAEQCGGMIFSGDDGMIFICPHESDDHSGALEFINAIATGIMEEADPHVSIGGALCQGVEGMKVAYAHALWSMDVAKQQYEEKISLFENMPLEQLAYAMPIEKAKELSKGIIQNDELLNGQLYDTIRACFDCRFNLSEAARKLYIHRNTLMYRLDKIKKASGLDIRDFDQSAALKFIMILAKRI